jgi:hypothetical protein
MTQFIGFSFTGFAKIINACEFRLHPKNVKNQTASFIIFAEIFLDSFTG